MLGISKLHKSLLYTCKKEKERLLWELIGMFIEWPFKSVCVKNLSNQMWLRCPKASGAVARLLHGTLGPQPGR